MSEELKACPCGKIPTKLLLEETCAGKYANAFGDCCNEWIVEYRTHLYQFDSDESRDNAIKAWNQSTRALPVEVQRVVDAARKYKQAEDVDIIYHSNTSGFLKEMDIGKTRKELFAAIQALADIQQKEG
jgi:hypothetical protein